MQTMEEPWQQANADSIVFFFELIVKLVPHVKNTHALIQTVHLIQTCILNTRHMQTKPCQHNGKPNLYEVIVKDNSNSG